MSADTARCLQNPQVIPLLAHTVERHMKGLASIGNQPYVPMFGVKRTKAQEILIHRWALHRLINLEVSE